MTYWGLRLTGTLTFAQIVIFLCENWTEIRFWFYLNEWIIMTGTPISSSWCLLLMMMTCHSVRISFILEIWSKVKSTGDFYVFGGRFYSPSFFYLKFHNFFHSKIGKLVSDHCQWLLHIIIMNRYQHTKFWMISCAFRWKLIVVFQTDLVHNSV